MCNSLTVMHVDPTLPYQACLVSFSAIVMNPLMQVYITQLTYEQ